MYGINIYYYLKFCQRTDAKKEINIIQKQIKSNKCSSFGLVVRLLRTHIPSMLYYFSKRYRPRWHIKLMSDDSLAYADVYWWSMAGTHSD